MPIHQSWLENVTEKGKTLPHLPLWSFFNVGRAIRTLRKWFGEHRRLIEKTNMVFPDIFWISSSGLQVWIIEAIPSILQNVLGVCASGKHIGSIP